MVSFISGSGKAFYTKKKSYIKIVLFYYEALISV